MLFAIPWNMDYMRESIWESVSDLRTAGNIYSFGECYIRDKFRSGEGAAAARTSLELFSADYVAMSEYQVNRLTRRLVTHHYGTVQ